MRLDKYLKTARLIKRRTVANEACDAERIEVNGKTAKSSYRVKVGDVIVVSYGTRRLKVRVLNINEHATKETSSLMYEEVFE